MEKKHYVKIFTDMACLLGLFSDDMIKTVKHISGSQKQIVRDDLKDVDITGLYLMQSFDDGCKANCAFCVQGRNSTHNKKKSYLVDNQLTRISTDILKEYLKKISSNNDIHIKRICIQTIYHDDTIDDLLYLIGSIKSICTIPITACCIPTNRENLVKLREAGLERITINYEIATPKLFEKLRGEMRGSPYRWELVTKSIDDALDVFGCPTVGSHLQVGLGETKKEVLTHIQNLKKKNVFVSLFAFRPLHNTDLSKSKRISYKDYHQVQLGSYLIQNDILSIQNISFNSNGDILHYELDQDTLNGIIESGKPFKNFGCPGCNRIFYETNPGERFYSYPRDLYPEEINLIKTEAIDSYGE